METLKLSSNMVSINNKSISDQYMTDRLDRSFMNGSISQEKYDQEIKYWNDWANREYEKVAK